MTQIYCPIIFTVLLGIIFYLSVNHTDGEKFGRYNFTKKYLNKNFTKADLSNHTIFDINELSKFIDRGTYAYNYKLIDFVKTGIDIVNDNSNFSLRLDMHFRYTEDIMYINDVGNNYEYEINYARKHHEDVLYMKVSHTNKTYKFFDLSQIELYFDSKK